LLPRFYDPSEGIVRIGGVDVRDLPIAELRARIGIVTQEVHLFSGNIRDNLTLFDDRVDDSLVIEVINGLGLDSWLDSLPRGLDTPLGAAGAGLSAGEAQILACARVFLRDPDLVILDESSSRLDPATERIVHDALGRLLEGRTGIIVAHKLSTLEFADEITVVEDGRIVEHGPRVALAADPSSRYSMLLDLASEEALV
jgi:ABC-type multidrug transport system fused ATPase/permease subunit